MNYENMLDHQDWKTIVINNKKTVKETKDNKKKYCNNTLLLKSIEKKADNDQLKHKKLTLELRNSLIKARNSLKLTQKELANKTNLSVQIINDIESGKSIYNHQHIQKLKRVLKITN